MTMSYLTVFVSVFVLICIPDVSSNSNMYCDENSGNSYPISSYDSLKLLINTDVLSEYWSQSNRICKQKLESFGWGHLSWKFTKFNASIFCTSRLQIHNDFYHTEFPGCGTDSRDLNKEYTLYSSVVYITVEADYRKDHYLDAEIVFDTNIGYITGTIAGGICGSLLVIFIITAGVAYCVCSKKRSPGMIIRADNCEAPIGSEGAAGYQNHPTNSYPKTSGHLIGHVQSPPPYVTLVEQQ